MRKNFLFCLAIIVFVTQCSITPEKITAPTTDENEEIVPIGNKIAGELLTTLKTELQGAIKEGGITNAIEVCNLKAILLTEMIANTSERIVSVKRITYKFRNPHNAPNEFEVAALDYFQEQIESNTDIPEYYTQKINEGDSSYYYFYKPLFVGNICLACHGDNETTTSDIKDQLTKLYPDDRAINYLEGDFRGLVSVIIRE